MSRGEFALLPVLMMLIGVSGAMAGPAPRYDPPLKDRSPAVMDSIGSGAAAPDSLVSSPARIVVDPGSRPGRRGHPSPLSVTLRSGLVPGWGQFANRKPLKAALLLGLDAWWLGNALHYENERSRLKALGDVAGVNAAVDRRNSKLWMMGATALYAMLDAYVDSFFADYDEGWTGRIGLDPEGHAVAALSYRF